MRSAWLARRRELLGADALLGELERLLEVLVRGAVVPPRQRLALARRSLARVRLALGLVPQHPELLRREAVEILDGELHVRLDHLVDAKLIVHREIRAHLREERPRGSGE